MQPRGRFALNNVLGSATCTKKSATNRNYFFQPSKLGRRAFNLRKKRGTKQHFLSICLADTRNCFTFAAQNNNKRNDSQL